MIEYNHNLKCVIYLFDFIHNIIDINLKRTFFLESEQLTA